MFNPAQMQKSYQSTVPIIRNSANLILDNIQNNTKSRWDQPIEIPPILYAKFCIPIPVPPKQAKAYPKSLLDYIKRSYGKCKDDNQKNMMEKLLRQIVKKFQNDFNQIKWQEYPLPNLQQESLQQKSNIVKQSQKVITQTAKSKLNQIKLLSCYNIVQQQKPSKAMQIAKKRSQKLQQKLNRAIKQQQTQPSKQTFMGFSSAPPVPPLQIKTPSKFTFMPPGPPPQPTVQNTPKTPMSSLLSNINLKSKQQPKPLPILKYQNTQLSQKKRQKQKKQLQKQKVKEKHDHKEKQKNKQKHSSQKISNAVQGKHKIRLEEKSKQSSKVTKKQQNLIEKLREKTDQTMNQVSRRYTDFNKLKNNNHQKDAIEEDSQIDFEQVIIGKSQSIEKPYLRITGRPNPDTVRPESILRTALQYFLKKYKKDKNYEYFISQLRSIRQDLTVQHIKNEFTVQVYEENLQISLYEKDIPQFKHCQTTLWQLYCQGLCYTRQSQNKFISHQMITLIMEDKSQQLQYMLTKIPQSSLDDQKVQQAIRLKNCLVLGNYTKFFNFYKTQDKFIRYLLDLYIDKMYVKFLLMVCRTCGEKVLVSNLSQMLNQQNETIQKIISSEGGVIQNNFLMLKPSYEQFLKSQHLVTKKVTVLLS